MKQVEGSEDVEATRYRLELDGELAEEWATWFGVDELHARGGRTVLEVTVTDQAALHGLLRRVHDLHLRLISLTRTTRSHITAVGTRPGPHQEETS